MTTTLADWRGAVHKLDAAVSLLLPALDVETGVVRSQIDSWARPDLHLTLKAWEGVRHRLDGVTARQTHLGWWAVAGTFGGVYVHAIADDRPAWLDQPQRAA